MKVPAAKFNVSGLESPVTRRVRLKKRSPDLPRDEHFEVERNDVNGLYSQTL